MGHSALQMASCVQFSLFAVAQWPAMVSPSMPSLGFFLTLTFAWLVFPREAQERWPKEEKGKQLFSWFSAGKPSWCQAEPGSCVGRRQTYKEPVVIDLVDREVKSIGDIRRFVDWDGDGDVDFLATYFDKVRQAHGYYGYHLGFFERLGNDTFRIHDLLQSCVDEVELHRFGYQYSELLHFEVADWDADGGMDVLVATYLNESLVVSWANRSTAMGHGELRRISVIMADSHLEPENEINEYPFPWNMKAVDWDLDGDADLILGSNYFERVDPDTVVQRIGDQNPLVPDMLNPSDISDISMDDDGYLNMVMAAVTHLEYGTRGGSRVSFRSFKRTLDGTFVEQVEHPLQDLWVENPMRQPPKSFLADWNSDGLPDIVVWNLWSQLEWYERTQERDMAQDHHTTLYDDIEVDGSCSELHLFDWNGDGFEDVLTYCGHQFQLYLLDGKKHLEVLGVFANITCNQACSIAMSDWDRDGDADVIITSNSGHVHYHEMIDGRLQEEQIQHPFSGLHLIVQGVSGGRWSGRWIPQPLAVDWDNDGDVDLVLGPPDFRYFERLYDGSLSEWSREESPFFIALAGDMDVVAWRFFDCDSDGDLDLVIVRVEPSYALVGTSFHVCEHTEHHALRCEGHILCLGTNLGNFHSESGPLGKLSGWDFGSARDGQLEVLTMHQDKVLHWRAGVCPALDPCHEKGLCLHGKTSCSCIEGHELADCSGCQPNFYSVEMSWGKAHGCEACPGEGGKVCHDRGLCFDDFAAKNDSQMATAALMARGHGSCLCSEGSFYGIDEQGRSTCAEGHCPAGTEETHGICISCQAGTYSLAGGACKKCGPGTKSSKGSSACERCSPGTISPGFGNSNCEECAAGKYEISRQWCNDCPSGSISSAGNDTCTKCTEGFYATLKGSSICDPCPAGTYSELGNTKCIPCPSGQFSGVGSSACSMCSAGTIASKAGSTECELCPAGTYAEEGGAKCIPCSLGQFSGVGSSACSMCSAGTTASKAGSTECELCPAGTYAEEGGAKCIPCSLGQFSGVGSLACSMCGAGTIARQAGSTECELCPAGTYAEAGSSKCLACYAGTISGAGSGNCSHCASGHFAKDSVACEACPGGTAAIDGACRSCPSGRVSGPASASCSSCDSILIRRTPDPAKQNCQISGLEVVLALIGLLTSAGCCFLCFSGCCARVPIADISDAQGQKLVVTTSIAHQILKSKKAREVTFHNTEVPDLEKEPWKVSALSSFQLTLQADHRENPLGHFHGNVTPEVSPWISGYRILALPYNLLVSSVLGRNRGHHESAHLVVDSASLLFGLSFGMVSVCVSKEAGAKRFFFATRASNFG